MNLKQVIAVDGPVGVGKSTVARRVAERLGFRHLNTGAMYRAVAWRVMQLTHEERNDQAVAVRVALNLRIELPEDGTVRVDGADLTEVLRDEAVGRFVAVVADNSAVREAMVEQQRRLGMQQPAVLEGRDIGTVVFPDAALKIYLDASPEVRTQRRLQQLANKGVPVDPEAVFRDLLERDQRDRSRPVGALRIARDAIMLDSTLYSEDAVVELVCALVRTHPVFAGMRLAS